MKKALIIDDEVDIGLLLKAIIKNSGFTADSACKLDSAINHLKSNDYDKIFLDVNLGRADGLSLLPLIRTTQPNAETVVISAQTDKSSMDAVRESGAKNFVSKPFRKEEILKYL